MAHNKNPINEYNQSSTSQKRFDYSISNVKTCYLNNRYTNKLLLTPLKDYFVHYLKLLLLQGGKLFFFYDTLNKFQLLLKDGKEKQTFTNPSPNLALHKIKSYT